MKTLLALAILSIFTTGVWAQSKYEHEKRVKESEVPSGAKDFLNNSFDEMKGLKWYYETANTGHSFEAKFDSNNDDYSVKFDTTGFILDIEKRIRLREIPSNTRKNIETYLDNNYQRHRIKKIQIQALGTREQLSTFIKKDTVEIVTINYEIEFHGITEEENKLWEALFDSEGKLILLREIILSPKYNLDF